MSFCFAVPPHHSFLTRNATLARLGTQPLRPLLPPLLGFAPRVSPSSWSCRRPPSCAMFSPSAPSSVDVQTNFYDGGTGSFLGLFRIAAGVAFKLITGRRPNARARARCCKGPRSSLSGCAWHSTACPSFLENARTHLSTHYTIRLKFALLTSCAAPLSAPHLPLPLYVAV